MKARSVILGLISVLVFGSCGLLPNVSENSELDGKDQLICSCEDPLNELEWLNVEYEKAIEQNSKGYSIAIEAYSYKGDNYFEINSRYASGRRMGHYNCNGENMNFHTSQEKFEKYEEYTKDRKLIRVLYDPFE